MSWPPSPYAVALALTALTLVGLAAVAWSRRAHTRGARSFSLFMLAAAVWAGAGAAQLIDPDPARQLLWAQLKLAGTALVPVGFLAFAHDYTRQATWLSGFSLGALLVIPAVTIGLAVTQQSHDILWATSTLTTIDGRPALQQELGPWFRVHLAYSYLLLALGSFYLVVGYLKAPKLYRAQMSLVLAAVLVPWLANIASVSGLLVIPGLDLTALTFSFSALAFARSLFSHRLLDIVPVAQETVMRYLSDAVIVTDARGRVLQINPAAVKLLGADSERIGRDAADLFPQAPALVAQMGGDEVRQLDVSLPTESGPRHFSAHLTPLADRRGRIAGHLLRLHDIERHVQAERTLHQAETTLKQQEQYLAALQDVTEGLIERRGLEEMLESVLRHAGAVLDAPHGAAELLTAEEDAIYQVRNLGQFSKMANLLVRRGEGLAGKVWQNMAPMRVDDYKHWEDRVWGMDTSWVRAAAAAPLVAGGQLVGVLTVARDRDDRRTFSRQDEALLKRFAQLGAVAVQNVRLIEEIEARRRESEQLSRIGTTMQESSSLQDRMDLILRAIQRVVGMERAVIWLPEDGGRALVSGSWIGFNPATVTGPFSFTMDGCVPVLEEAFLQGEEVVLEAQSPIPAHRRMDPALAHVPLLRSRAMAALPLVSRGRTVGVLAVDNHQQRKPLSPSLPILRRFAASAAVAIDSAQLYQAVQDELQERKVAEERYRSILEQLEDPYFETDLRGRLRMVNPAFADSVQGQADGLVGGSLQPHVSSGQRPEVAEAFADVARGGGGTRRLEIRYRRRDGSQWYGETSIGLIREDGLPVGYRGMVRNVEDRKRHELELQAAKEAAEAANEAKSAFLANVSHELRTPLTSILGFARIIERRFDEVILPLLTGQEDRKVQRAVEQVRGNSQIIYRESQRLTTLINDVLDLAKIEAGQATWNLQRLGIGSVIQRALEATEGLYAHRQELQVRAQVDDDLPEVEADPDRMVQVVINLISNAVKFTQAGEVLVAARREGDRVVVSVRDAGVGIAPEDQAAVFEQFKQVGDTLTEKPQGTGLGLPICKQIVEHHGGRIWLESALGHGSTFSFELPSAERATVSASSGALQTADTPPPPMVEQLRSHVLALLRRLREEAGDGAGSSGEGEPLFPATVLVVDDDPQIRSLLRQVLEEAGHGVEEASDGRQALNAVRQHRPGLVILDVMMPELSGFDVAAVLKGDPDTAGIPIIVLTVVQDPQRGYQLGVERYMTKPVEMSELLREVHTLLSAGSGQHLVVVVEDADDPDSVRELAGRTADALRDEGLLVQRFEGLNGAAMQPDGQVPALWLLSEATAKRDGALASLRRSGRLGDAAVVVYG